MYTCMYYVAVVKYSSTGVYKMANNKKQAQRKASNAAAAQTANSKLQLAAIATSTAHAQKTAQPAIIANIMQQLYNAKLAQQHVSVAQLMQVLCKQFPQRKASSMHITVRAQLARMQSERNFQLSKKRVARNMFYAAAL
jgi:hypothetical protein